MKRFIKKTGAAAITMAMLLSMGAMSLPTFAASGDAKTIQVYDLTNGTAKAKITGVSVYKVATLDANTGKWAWTSDFSSIGQDITKLNSGAQQMNKLARDLKALAEGKTKVTAQESTLTGGKAYELAISGKGYYLVIPTVDDNDFVVQPALVEIDAAGEAFTVVKAKANPLPLDKAITSTVAGDVSTTGDTSVGIVGSVVEYKITSYLPDYAADVTTVKPFVLTDDPSDGIKINNTDFTANGSNVVVKIDNTTASGVQVAAKGDGFTVTVPSATVLANKGKEITVTFKATIDTDAVMGGTAKCSDADTVHDGKTGNPNTVILTWGNNYSTGEYAYPSDHTPEPNEPDVPDEPQVEKKDTVTTYVGEVKLIKKGDADTGLVNLDGAVFTLESDAAGFATKTLTTADGGKIDFGYLPEGNYTLTETKAPSGYKTINSTYTFSVETKNATTGEFETYEVSGVEIENVVTIDLDKNDSVALITVIDPPADTLPGTGGIGTYVFTFGGLAIVLLAGVLFVIYMKKRKVED